MNTHVGVPPFLEFFLKIIGNNLDLSNPSVPHNYEQAGAIAPASRMYSCNECKYSTPRGRVICQKFASEKFREFIPYVFYDPMLSQ